MVMLTPHLNSMISCPSLLPPYTLSVSMASAFVSVNYVTGKRFIVVFLLASAAMLAAQNAGGRPIHNEQERLAKWKPVQMPFHSSGLSVRERKLVEKLV